jgi:transposase
VTTQVRLIATLNTEIEQLGEVVAAHFGRHRDAERYLSLPGLGVVLGARILGEFGDDRTKFRRDCADRLCYGSVWRPRQ